MRYFTAQRGTFLCISAALLCLFPRPGWADGQSEPASSSQSSGTSAIDLGTGIFSRFPIQVSASVHGGYDDNINTSQSDKQDSWFMTAGLALAYDLGTPRTKLSLATTTGFTYYANATDNQYEPTLNLSLSLAHKASGRLTFNLSSFILYQTEPDFNYALGTNRRAGNYFATQDRFGVSYLWTPRFSTATSYTFSAVHYDEMAAGFFEDRVENTIGNEFRFLLWPTTNVVADYRFQAVTYEHINRDSTTHFFLAGLDHVFNSRLTGAFRAGVEFRDYVDTPEKTSPYFESTVNYIVGKSTSASWSNHYEIEEGDVTLNPTRTTFRTGLQARHGITTRVSGSVSVYYSHDEYDSSVAGMLVSPAFSEDSITLGLSLRYAFNRYVGVEAGYNFAEVSGGAVLREYTRNRIWGGFNVTF